MRKFLMCIVLSAVLCCIFGVSARDLALTTINDEHDMTVLATISDIDDESITADVYNSVGVLPGDKTQLAHSVKIKKFRYTYCSEHAQDYNTPKVGDNIFISLNAGEENGTEPLYEAVGAVYKTDTVDIRTLSVLAPDEMKNKDCMDDIVAVAYYIRSDGMQKEFNFGDGTVGITKEGKEIRLYPPDVKTQLPIKYIDKDGKIVSTDKKQDVIAVNPNNPVGGIGAIDRGFVTGRRIIAVGIIAAGLIIGMIAVYIGATKHKKI